MLKLLSVPGERNSGCKQQAEHLSIEDGAEDLAAGRGYVCILLPKVGVVGQAIVLVCGDHRHNVAVPVRGRVRGSRIDIHPCMQVDALVSEHRLSQLPTIMLARSSCSASTQKIPCQELEEVYETRQMGDKGGIRSTVVVAGCSDKELSLLIGSLNGRLQRIRVCV